MDEVSPGDAVIAAAIARGDSVAHQLVTHRDALIEHMAPILLIAGEAGLRACAAGAAEAVIIASRNLARRRTEGEA